MFVIPVIFHNKISPWANDKLCKIYSEDIQREILNFKKGFQDLLILRVLKFGIVYEMLCLTSGSFLSEIHTEMSIYMTWVHSKDATVTN